MIWGVVKNPNEKLPSAASLWTSCFENQGIVPVCPQRKVDSWNMLELRMVNGTTIKRLSEWNYYVGTMLIIFTW